jgi:dipeptidyl aminopeptidase/acylaminoacyl peptidase
MKKQFIIGILLLSNSLMAQQNMTPETLWKLGRLQAETIDQKNNKVIFKVSNYNLEQNKAKTIFFNISTNGGAPTQISNNENIESIIQVDAKTGQITYTYKGQIWQMNADGSDAKQITKIKGSIDNVRISPDGKHILFSKEVAIDKVEGKNRYTDLSKSNAYVFDDLNYRHWDTWSSGKFSHIFYASYNNGEIGTPIDIMKDEHYDVPQKPFGGKEDVIWSPDSKSIIYVSKKKYGKDYATSTNTDIYRYELETKQTANLSKGMMGYDTQPAFNKDGSILAWTAMAEDGYEADKNDIWIFDFKKNECFNLTKDWDETVGSFIWSNDMSKIYFLAYVKGTEQVFELSIPKNPKAGQTAAIKKITQGVWDINSIVGQTGNKLIVTKTDMNHAAELFSVDLKSGNLDQLTAINKEIYDGIELSDIQERWVKTSDGKDMLTWVIYPPNFDPTKKYPTLLYCQGGPQSALSQFYSFRWNFQLMAAQGYIVVAPNRRGMPGFGVEWNKQISGDWGGQPMRDYLSAIDDVAKEPYVDKDRLGCVGASYGGYSVFMLAGLHENRFKTFISHNGLFDLKSWYGTTEELFFANKDVGGPYWLDEQPQSYTKANPSNLVKNWNTPIMIVQGGKDYRVPVEQGLQAYQAAQLKGIKSRLLYFPEENHWVISPQNSILWQREFFNWLKETL